MATNTAPNNMSYNSNAGKDPWYRNPSWLVTVVIVTLLAIWGAASMLMNRDRVVPIQDQTSEPVP